MAKRVRNETAARPPKAVRDSRRAARERRRRIKTIAWAGGITAVVALLVGVAVSQAANRPGEAMPDQGNQHIEMGQPSPIDYNSTPPTSGSHYESIARWGVHTEPIPDPLQVHNLEDGGVGVWYDCPEGCPEVVSQLADVVRQYDEGVLLAPYPGMESPIVLTAWTRIERLDEFDRERIERFIAAYRGLDHHVRR